MNGNYEGPYEGTYEGTFFYFMWKLYLIFCGFISSHHTTFLLFYSQFNHSCYVFLFSWLEEYLKYSTGLV